MERLNINRASAAQLIELPGIGPQLAERIVQRTRRHSIRSLEDLLEVPGITTRVLDRFRDVVSTGNNSEQGTQQHSDGHVRVQLASGREGADYTGFVVRVSGTRREDDSAIPFLSSASVSRAGEASLSLPSRQTLEGAVTVEVAMPDGSMAASLTLAGSDLPDPITVKTPPRDYGTTQPNKDPAAGKPVRIRGRVIDAAGRPVPAGLQVVLWGAQAEQPSDVDYRALIVASTDAMGHFTGPYPLGRFTAAHATVAAEGDPRTVPVHLVDETFPAAVILVTELPEADRRIDDKGCGCQDGTMPPRSPEAADLARADGTFSSDTVPGRCVDFTRPDRTLEEYSYSYVVRTTEPEIRGLTLAEPPRIDIQKLRGLIQNSIGTTALRSASVGSTADDAADGAAESRQYAAAAARLGTASQESVRVDAQLLSALARDPDGFSLTTLAKSVQRTSHADLLRTLLRATGRKPGRSILTCANPVDWDDDPTIYQACTIAHGHVLRFKQEWVADGYSMGNLLYSLPLAPGQKKQIAVVDWERRETSGRTEESLSTESLQAVLQRDRDISDVVSGVVNERTRGGSNSSSGSVAGGIGIGAIIGPVGGLIGVGGGHSSASSSSWQDSSRSTAANALNQLHDRTVQSASAVRSQRSSVVQTVRQGERVTATTETVANYNHCHAITIQYFEVLRHLLVRQRITDVQECLFVPLLMSRFTDDKALRWRDTLSRVVPRGLAGGLAALDRIAHNYAGSDLPLGRYADEQILSVDGDLQLRFELARPRDTNDDFDATAWSPLLQLFGFNPKDFYDAYLRNQQFKDRVFLEQLGPRIAAAVVGLLQVQALRHDGSTADLHVDPTLISSFKNDRELYVTLRMQQDPDPVNRADVKAVIISSHLKLPGLPFVIDALPAGSRVIVESGTMRYRTAHHEEALFNDRQIRNDLTGSDDVRIQTPLSRQEMRNPRQEDRELARNLLDHLNEHIERYHHAIWARMSDDRRYMLLDGFEAPNAGGRSVASVVDNELIGIVGNCLVLPVARGFHLDPTFNQDAKNPIDLLEHYQPNTPLEPTRLALPTRGVYAEAVMGQCNSCEFKEEQRFWRWEESPIPDSPPQILPTSTDSRRADPPDLTAKDFPGPIIAMQNAPAAPDPAGVAGVLQLLGQAGIFRDAAGLEGTQRNAAAALDQAFQTATTFGTKAADLALQARMAKDVDKAMRTIQQAKAEGLINESQAQELTQTAIRGMVGAGTTNPSAATTTTEVKKLAETAGANNAALKVSRPTGEKVEIDARSAQDGARPIIILEGDTDSAELRAFHPSRADRTLVVQVGASFRNAPDGARLRWSSPSTGALIIDNPDSERTRVRGVRPGVHDLALELLDGGGNRIASLKLKMSVPQCVRVIENAADFDAAITDAQLTGRKNDLVAEMKRVVERLHRRTNVRVFWQLGGMNDALPAHVPADHVVVATIRNKDAGGKLGVTDGAAADSFNETITLYPGMYSEPSAIDVDTETRALILQLQSSVPGDPDLAPIAIRVFGRLIGETLSHEIGHALLWDDIPADGHNSPAIANDLMNRGVERLFRQRTGMENTVKVSPVLPEHYVDHGLAAIGDFQAINQGLIDSQWPVPPHFA